MIEPGGRPRMKKLGFGFMRLPVLDENDRSTVDIPLTEKMVRL